MKSCTNKQCNMHIRERTFPDKINFCEHCGNKLETVVTPIEHTMYVNGDKDSNYQLAEEMNLSDEATITFAHTLDELPIVVKTNPVTGGTKMIGVKSQGQVIYLREPVEV